MIQTDLNDLEFVYIYHGQVINRAELLNWYGDKTAPYGVRLNANTFVDSASLRGVGSLANHSKDVRDVNADLSVYYGERNIGERARILAIEPIRNGDEIFIDYGDEYTIDEEGISYSTLPR